MNGDPIADARGVVTERYPDARWAVLAGSVLTGARTAGSDLDIVVLLADGGSRAPRRESLWYRDRPVEIFVHDDQTLAHYFARDGTRPVLRRMVATGTPLLGDPAPWQESSREVLAAGPRPSTGPERDWERYVLTDLLDDLAHATDVE